jgi:hypothetical protein
MKKIKKIALILLIWIITIFFISVIQNNPISLSINEASFFQIPIIFWLVILISPFLLYIIAKDSRNPLVPQFCVILYFFFFYSYGLYFLFHPTITDISSNGLVHTILPTTSHIDPQEINSGQYLGIAQYFKWPVFFIFSKIFALVLNIGTVQTINLGFFSLLLISPFLLSLFYKNSINKLDNTTLYFIIPALYLTLGWHFINDQFVPQFLALVFLFILFGSYVSYRKSKNPLFLILIIIYYILTVYTHAFIFIFFLITIIFEIYWSEYVESKRAKFISYGLIIIFFGILYPYISLYYSLITKGSGGESWRLFQRFFSERTSVGTGIQVQNLYNLVPKIFDQLITESTRVAIVLVIAIVAIGFILNLYKKKELLDLSILISSASWFILGLANLVLGQRAIQIASLSLAKNFKSHHKSFSHISKIIIILIIFIAPLLFIANNMINSSISGEELIQDPEENIAGRFIDRYASNKSILLSAHNAFPTGYPSGLQKFRGSYSEARNADLILNSPKLQKTYIYHDITFPRNLYDSILYDNADIEIIFLQKGMK